jgi:hypothetical protein
MQGAQTIQERWSAHFLTWRPLRVIAPLDMRASQAHCDQFGASVVSSIEQRFLLQRGAEDEGGERPLE